MNISETWTAWVYENDEWVFRELTTEERDKCRELINEN